MYAALMLFEGLECAALEFGRLIDYQQPLLPAEVDLASGVTRARLWELRAGRTAARKALCKLAMPPAAILCGEAGEPIWPNDVCGSLSHTPTHIAALIAWKSQWRAVGIDVNDSRPLGVQLDARVMSEAEIEVLLPLASRLKIDPGNLAFSAKEAFFKSQHLITGNRDVSFQDVELRLSHDSQRFSAVLTPCGLSGELRFDRLDDQLVCCCLVPPL